MATPSHACPQHQGTRINVLSLQHFWNLSAGTERFLWRKADHSLPFQEFAWSEEVLTLHTSTFFLPNQHPAIPCSLMPPLTEPSLLLSLIPKDFLLLFNPCRLFIPCGAEIAALSNLFSSSSWRHTLDNLQSLKGQCELRKKKKKPNQQKNKKTKLCKSKRACCLSNTVYKQQAQILSTEDDYKKKKSGFLPFFNLWIWHLLVYRQFNCSVEGTSLFPFSARAAFQ